MVLWALENAGGGEIFVPKIPSYRIVDVAAAVAPECRLEIVGIRPGEKIHEEMITTSDSLNTVDIGRYYAILPSTADLASHPLHSQVAMRPVAPGFSYNSGSNEVFLSVQEIRDLVSTHVFGQATPL
jgi:FlaA1/EpsC-like NDP-sugar epimerase